MSTPLRIHGDNIIECERMLFLIANSFSATVHQVISPPYLPQYEIRDESKLLFTVELLSGYGRWNINLQEILQFYGAPLREATDAVVTQILPNEEQEQILLACEFSSALPAGNNAWQRNGRALSCAAVGIPYLYFAEIGGVELDENRVIKAPRFPNPIIPFSYLTASKLFSVVCLPVYSVSPSSLKSIRIRFEQVFGLEEGQQLVKCILGNTLINDPYEKLTQKALTITEILSAQRQRIDTLREKQWTEFLNLETLAQKTAWLEQNGVKWSKKGADKVAVTQTFQRFIRLFSEIGCLSVGAKDIPLCLIPYHQASKLAEGILALYGSTISVKFVEWIASLDLPLVVIWITGFKPRGDDSRPDRGLVPLARMLFGNEVNILSIVYGPAKPAVWTALQNSPQQLARDNGLWEAIVNLSDAILIDSVTAINNPSTLLIQRSHRHFQGEIRFSLASPTRVFSEQDVDTTLHLLFAHNQFQRVFEAMCNPPGGDWSGLSIFNFQSGEEYRWTSLPRVSGVGGKRPDHVIEFLLDNGNLILLAIESKNRATNLEPNVGNRLETYTRQLVETPPTIFRATNAEWNLWQNGNIPLSTLSVISGGAFCWVGVEELEDTITRCQVDIVIAIEFNSIEQSALLHVKAGPGAELLLPKIYYLIQHFGGRLEIQVH
ncbi:MAG: hypothetical protein BroJett011_55400 [Chloroflexota bacterium]|nr:MAG: hypothetical protein BroJett011_55400 [Chloroflexota bacterium]